MAIDLNAYLKKLLPSLNLARQTKGVCQKYFIDFTNPDVMLGNAGRRDHESAST